MRVAALKHCFCIGRDWGLATKASFEVCTVLKLWVWCEARWNSHVPCRTVGVWGSDCLLKVDVECLAKKN